MVRVRGSGVGVRCWEGDGACSDFCGGEASGVWGSDEVIRREGCYALEGPRGGWVVWGGVRGDEGSCVVAVLLLVSPEQEEC